MRHDAAILSAKIGFIRGADRSASPIDRYGTMRMNNFVTLVALDRWAIVVGLGSIIVGVVTAVRPIAMIGLCNRKRAAMLLGGGLSLAALAIFVYDYELCPSDILCGRCSPSHQRVVRRLEPLGAPSPAEQADQQHDASPDAARTTYIGGC